MPGRKDGPASPLFAPASLRGNVDLSRLGRAGVSKEMAARARFALTGASVAWGIPFRIGRPVLVKDKPVAVKLKPTRAQWLVFLHTSDVRPIRKNSDGFVAPMRGGGQLGEHAADYVILYANGAEARLPIRRRHELGMFSRRWGENCFEAVPDAKVRPLEVSAQRRIAHAAWGRFQTRADSPDLRPWVNWLWAWENPHPRRAIVGIRFEPACGSRRSPRAKPPQRRCAGGGGAKRC